MQLTIEFCINKNFFYFHKLFTFVCDWLIYVNQNGNINLDHGTHL